jgi:pre-mRNA-splicing factor 18
MYFAFSYKIKIIFLLFKDILKRWAKDLNERDENIKKSARGKLQAGMHKQTVEHLGPLVHSLVKHSVNSDIRVHLTNIAR